MRRLGLTALLAILAIGALALTGPLSGATAGKGKKGKKGKTYTVKVADDYFQDSDITVKLGDKVKWKWDSQNVNPHNVTLEKGPKGVKKGKFESATGAIGVKFNWTFDKKGTYDYLCTLHATVMKGTVEVKGKKKKKG